MESSREELDVMSSVDCSQVHVQCVFSLLSLAAQRVGRCWKYIVKFYCAPELIAARQLFARISLCLFLNGDFYCPPRRKVSTLFGK